MTETTLKHSSISLSRSYPVPPAKVFAAWADPEARKIWGTPGEGITLEHEAADFSVGGVDISLCQMEGATIARVETRYLDIVPDARLLLIEAIASEGMHLGASLVSVEMTAEGAGTALSVTIQTAGLDGSGLEVEVEGGWVSALDNLGRMLAAAGAATA